MKTISCFLTITCILVNMFSVCAQDFSENKTVSFENIWKGSSKWADIDNDNDLDLILCGGTFTTPPYTPVTKIYLNNGGAFSEQTSPIVGVCYSGLDLGDYDNDGDLDLVITGKNNSGQVVCNVYTNENGSFTINSNISITPVYKGEVLWVDYNNDGKSDLFVCGNNSDDEPIAKMYQNIHENLFEEQTGMGFTGVTNACASLTDFNNDGFTDLLISGSDGTNEITVLYKNEHGNAFSVHTTTIDGVIDGSANWSDYNNDGYMDLIITGQSDEGLITKIYQNNAENTFSELVGTPFAKVKFGKVIWGNYNNDSLNDIIVAGNDFSGKIAKLYKNTGSNLFIEQQISDSLEDVRDCSLNWVDYDKDNDPDVFLTGYTGSEIVTKLYTNNATQANTKPSPPDGLAGETFINTDSTGTVMLSWNPATDTETPVNGITYNLSIRQNSIFGNILNSLSNDSTGVAQEGYRKIVGPGNCFHVHDSVTFNLPYGQYLWKVQAIDNVFSGSTFSTEQSFTIGPYNALDTVPLPQLAWGAARWGDYDNDGDMDIMVSGADATATTHAKIFRNNGNGHFIEQLISLTGVYGTGEWADVDNDNDLDLLISGYNTAGYHSFLYTNNGDNTFSETFPNIPKLVNSSIDFGDYDNDGDLDVIITGTDALNNKISRICSNDGYGNFDTLSMNLTGVKGDAKWGDFNNDGYLDIFLTGFDGTNRNSQLYLYKNNLDMFVTVPFVFEELSLSKVDLADYNSDGFLDILLTGKNSSNQPKTIIYKNTNGTGFTEIPGTFHGVYNGFCKWLDYDNDGDMDFIVSGDDDGSEIVAKAYKNNGGDNFTEDGSIDIEGVKNGSIDAADYDNDGDMDIIISGNNGTSNVTRIYRNQRFSKNTPPAAPGNPVAEVNDHHAVLSWTPPADDLTPSPGLSYNIMLDSINGTRKIITPMADETSGYRLIPKIGNSEMVHSGDTIKNLSFGTYTWSVQAVDNGYLGSAWATDTFMVRPESVFVVSSDTVCIYSQNTFTYTGNAHDTAHFNWDFDGGTILSGSGKGPYTIYWDTPGSKSTQLIVTENGVSSLPTNYMIEVLHSSAFTIQDTVCANETAPLSYTGNAPSDALFTWHTDNGIIAGSGKDATGISWENAGDKSVSLIVEDRYCGSDTAESNVLVYPVPTADFTVSSASVCKSDTIIAAYTGTATAGASYSWDFGTATLANGTGQGPYSLAWNDYGNKEIRLFVEENNCQSDTNSIIVTIPSPYQKENICVLTTDQETGHNMVVWERTPGKGIAHYNIYRKRSGEYEKIGESPYDSLSVFVDLTSLFENQAEIYKITATDTCGNESSLDSTNSHTTILLQWNSNAGGVNLGWSKYKVNNVDFDFQYYILYRGSDSTSLDSIATLDNTLDRYTDNSPEAMTGLYYYRIGGVKDPHCAPKKLKSSAGPFSQSISNLEDNRLKGNEIDALNNNIHISVYPNPADEMLHIDIQLNTVSKLTIKILNSVNHAVYTNTLENIKTFSGTIDVSKWPSGLYLMQVMSDEGMKIVKLVVD